jgi:hypothetical protein
MVVDQLIGQADAIRTRAQHLVCDLIPDQFALRPDPSKWSIAECMQLLERSRQAERQ